MSYSEHIIYLLYYYLKLSIYLLVKSRWVVTSTKGTLATNIIDIEGRSDVFNIILCDRLFARQVYNFDKNQRLPVACSLH